MAKNKPELYSYDASLRILALQAARHPDRLAQFRRVARWYSQNFATPLHQVFELPEEFVLQHYYEHHYESLDDEDWRQEVLETVETPAERAARLQAEAEADVNLMKRAREDRARIAKIRQERKDAEADRVRKDFEEAQKQFSEILAGLPASILPAEKPGAKVKAATPAPEAAEATVMEPVIPEGIPDLEFKLGEGGETPLGIPEPPAPPKRRR